ncbi:hypothetical protein [Noviherbaspirillum sp.]|uniref:hypothetical protein n=1 Tax=Noviherbaspirillum sp. TaxID=1926288 RepID=UPI002FE0AECC
MADIQSRRVFLKAGLIGTLTLTAAGGLYRFLHNGTDQSAAFRMNQDAKAVLTAIIPVVLKGAIVPTVEAIDTALHRVQDAISGLPLSTQKEIQDLFGLLTLAPSRRLLAGLTEEWPQASPEQVQAFLEGWRNHRFALMQSAYHALHDLITGSWYADESTWQTIGYPGPMKELS